ncbi:MAG TPA: zinc-binding dehydrogenase, partial [Minicystis sp.]|nr:zinc-binding dehydrogenase [Minicystis sp.]
PGARGVTVGARVLVQPGLSCGVCAQCLAGRDNLCRSYRILGENAQGGYARHVHLPDVNVVPIPDSLDFEHAAATPLCTLTAWQMVFEKGEVKPGQTVVVHAAGSGVSSIAIQLAKLAGARVVATTTQRAKAEPARAIGADEVIVTSEEDYVAAIKRVTNKAGADVILDHVGGELFEKAILAAAWGGRIVTCGATAGFRASVDLRQIFFRQVAVLGSTMGSKGVLLRALPLVTSGRVKPPVDRVLPLWEAREAHRALEAREVFGKVVLTVD